LANDPWAVSGNSSLLCQGHLIAFKKGGVDLVIAALGNEIRHGMLWPIGKVDVDIEPMSALVANFSNLATPYKSARAGVDDAVDAGVKMPEVLIHIDDGWNITLQQRLFGALVANDVKTTDWTTFGFSFYPFYGTSATFANLKNSR
jgi:arabinogalactan endo-1,4-beta-galactosidase